MPQPIPSKQVLIDHFKRTTIIRIKPKTKSDLFQRKTGKKKKHMHVIDK